MLQSGISFSLRFFCGYFRSEATEKSLRIRSVNHLTGTDPHEMVEAAGVEPVVLVVLELLMWESLPIADYVGWQNR